MSSHIPTNAYTQGMSMDLRSLDRLKSSSASNPSGQVREVAKQLEGLFMQELMKSMRATTMSTGMLDNSATDLGTSMLDTQLANQMTGLPGGLSEMIARQLEGQLSARKPATTHPAHAQGPLDQVLPGTSAKPLSSLTLPGTDPVAAAETAKGRKLSNSEAFIVKHQQAAKAAEAATGIPAQHILGQAALESGWGKREIKSRDGQPSHNLFGIKATSDWKGRVAEVTTTEYIGGVARKVTAKFRAYDSYEEAFKDHARLLTKSPRYSRTVAQADTAQGFAQGLQKAGYATDPAYADKLTKVINMALRVQRTLT